MGLEICILIRTHFEKLIWPSSLHTPGEAEPERGGDWPKMTCQNWTGARLSGPWSRMFSNPAIRQGSLPQRRGGEAHTDVFPEYPPGTPTEGVSTIRDLVTLLEMAAAQMRQKHLELAGSLHDVKVWEQIHGGGGGCHITLTGGKLWSDLRRTSLSTST